MFVKRGGRSRVNYGCDKCNRDNADSVCISKAGCVAVDCGDNDGTYHKKPVGERDVDLSMEEF